MSQPKKFDDYVRLREMHDLIVGRDVVAPHDELPSKKDKEEFDTAWEANQVREIIENGLEK